MLELISIHIPKTAGRSLLKMLIDIYGERHVLVVNRKEFKQNPATALQNLRKQITPEIKVIHGHIHVSEIKPVIDENPDARLIAFLRDPVERVISHYFHEKRILAETGHLSGFKQVPVDTIENYARDPESQNVMCRFADGVPLSRYFFIGHFENYGEHIRELAARMKWQVSDIPMENVNESQSAYRDTVTPSDRELIRSLNSRDVKLYSEARSQAGSDHTHKIRCWIASFPRSGNTYFRNILYYVYGMESGTWHKETAFPVDADYDQYPFVKTHLLPGELLPADPSIPAIYLVRDGRDAVVSIAHQRSDLVEPGSDFENNLREAIVAAEGSFFGGWSNNVAAWLRRAALVIRYEDLIADPRQVFKRVEQVVELPPADWSKLPSFAELKSGKPKYGGVSKQLDPKFNPEEFSSKFFRKGKSGGWKEEMSPEIQDLFWCYHGEMMERMGYEPLVSTVPQNDVLDGRVMDLLGGKVNRHNKKINILIEATKLTQPGNDGVKRYLIELLKGFEDLVLFGNGRFHFELLVGRKFLPLSSYRQLLRIEPDELHNYEKVLMAIKSAVKKVLPRSVYEAGAGIYRQTDARKILKKIQAKKSVEKELSFYLELEEKKREVDILHIPLPQNADHLKNISHRFLVTVHDLTHRITPQFHVEENIRLAESGIRFIVEKKAGVIAVSHSTAADLHHVYEKEIPGVSVVYEAPDHDLFRWNVNNDLAAKVRNKYKIGTSPYLMTLSIIEPRKNLPNVIRAFNSLISQNPELDINLVIAGSFGWKTDHLSRELHLNNPRIIFTGFIDDRDLHVLYSGARALCYLSHYEGFGLPPLEAMRCRTPVIFANNSSLAEIIGDAGLACDAGDVNGISMNMKKMVTDPHLRESLAQKALHRSFMFSRRKMTMETVREYELMIND